MGGREPVRHRFPRTGVFVFARSEAERAFARELGAVWAGDTAEPAPEKLNSIIDTTPAWTPVVDALDHLSPGGRLVINAIAKLRTDKDALLRLDYQRHLWMEREIRSVANVTRRDVRETLAAAVALGLRPTVEEIPFDSAHEALASLRRGDRVRGARVLRIAEDSGKGTHARLETLAKERIRVHALQADKDEGVVAG